MGDIGADAFPVRRQGSGAIRARPGLQVGNKRRAGGTIGLGTEHDRNKIKRWTTCHSPTGGEELRGWVLKNLPGKKKTGKKKK